MLFERMDKDENSGVSQAEYNAAALGVPWTQLRKNRQGRLELDDFVKACVQSPAGGQLSADVDWTGAAPEEW